MATKPRSKKPKVEDEAQSRRFIEMARELEESGGLPADEAERVFDRAVTKSIRPTRN